VGPVPRTAMCSSCAGLAGTCVNGEHAVLVYGTLFLSVLVQSRVYGSGQWVKAKGRVCGRRASSSRQAHVLAVR